MSRAPIMKLMDLKNKKQCVIFVNTKKVVNSWKNM